jgi:hypothetical protein
MALEELVRGMQMVRAEQRGKARVRGHCDRDSLANNYPDRRPETGACGAHHGFAPLIRPRVIV